MPVIEHLGLNPTYVDGTMIGGYLTPEDMLEAVKKHSGG